MLNVELSAWLGNKRIIITTREVNEMKPRTDIRGFILLVIVSVILWHSMPADAEPYIGIGHTVYNPSDNGVWWQQGLDHHIDNESNSLQIGYKFNTEYPISIGYMNLGKINSWAIATSDADFNGSGCNANPCAYSDVYIGTGEAHGFYLTTSKGIKYRDVDLFVTGGLWVFQAKFNMTIANHTSASNHIGWNVNKNEDWQIRPIVGLGVEYDKTSLIVSAWGSILVPSRWTQYPTIKVMQLIYL
jgi:hypothetical protein